MKRAAAFDAIGTRWSIDLPETLDAATVSSVLDTVHDRINTFDQTYSRFRADSLVTRISQATGRYQFPADASVLFAWYRLLYDLTNGAVTPLIGNALSNAGYDAEYSLIEKPMTSPKAWDDVMRFDATSNILETSEPVLLDFGAAGKGYLIDIVAAILRDASINSYCIDAGGDIAYRSETNEPLRIGLENPHDTSEAIGVATIGNQSICGSAGNRRRWGRFHHTLDPRTLTSPTDIAAVWVVADATMIADGLTTALNFVSPETLSPIIPFSCAVLGSDGHLSASPNFPAEFFLAS
jgi:FAD:protein FMN transferase